MKRVYETYKKNGWLQVICPFCEIHFETSKTPLEGTGKRCPKCKALHKRGKATQKEIKK